MARLAEGRQEAGYHKVVWRALDQQGRAVPGGLYLARLPAADYTRSVKLVLLK